MTTRQSPWLAQFDGLLDREVIRRRAEFKPAAISGLLTLPPHIARNKLYLTLDEVITLSDEELDFVERVVFRSHAYVTEAYQSNRQYMATLHSKKIPHRGPPPICLTGLAGTGKSVLLTAIQRVLPNPIELNTDSAIVNNVIPIRSYARTRVDAISTFGEFLAPWLPESYQQDDEVSELNPENSKLKNSPKLSTNKAVEKATRHSYRVGIHTSLVDEMQFLTMGQSASATPTKFLLMMSYLGVPLIYAANYSLCNKLLKRNHEDKDRLLNDVFVHRPLTLSEESFSPLLRIYDEILGECVGGSLCSFFPLYASMTLGIKRKIRDLTIHAFEEMRRKGDLKLKEQHFKTAYEKRLPKPFRDSVQDLLELNSLSKSPPGKSDLWCPFGIEYNRFSLMPGMGEGSKTKTIADGLLHSMLTPSEKKSIAGFAHLGKPDAPYSVDQDGKQVRRERSKSKSELSAAELLRNTILHKQGI